jgi:hypothetical protein
MTDDVSASTQARLARLMQHANEVIARRARGVDEAPTQEEAERRKRDLFRFMDQIERERAALLDRLKRQEAHAAHQEARAMSKGPPRKR